MPRRAASRWVARLDADDGRVLWTAQFGSARADELKALAFDARDGGSLYAAGTTFGAFPGTAPADGRAPGSKLWEARRRPLFRAAAALVVVVPLATTTRDPRATRAPDDQTTIHIPIPRDDEEDPRAEGSALVSLPSSRASSTHRRANYCGLRHAPRRSASATRTRARA